MPRGLRARRPVKTGGKKPMEIRHRIPQRQEMRRAASGYLSILPLDLMLEPAQVGVDLFEIALSFFVGQLAANGTSMRPRGLCDHRPAVRLLHFSARRNLRGPTRVGETPPPFGKSPKTTGRVSGGRDRQFRCPLPRAWGFLEVSRYVSRRMS